MQSTVRVRYGLDALNFFLADVESGLGPFLAIYLLAVRGWDPGTIGLVITLAGLVGIAAQTPVGAMIDRSRNKRMVLIVAAVAVAASCLVLPLVQGFALVAVTQSMAAVAATVFPPGLAAVTLGVFGAGQLARRIGRNQAFNHAGNAVAAGLAAVTSLFYGPVVVFWILGGLAVLSIGSTLVIPADCIDDERARGLEDGGAGGEQPSGWRVLLGNRKLLLLAVLFAVFHLANAAMLPSVGQKLTAVVGKENATSLISVCIVAAQLVMVPVAAVVGARTDRWGRKPIFLAAFGVLALRGGLYTLSDNPYWLVAVQCLDGVGAGIYGALFPVIVADLTRGTGRFNVTQGAMATAQGIGAALSASLAGLMIVWFGYSAAFLTLGAIAAAGFVGFLFGMPETRALTQRHESPVAAGTG